MVDKLLPLLGNPDRNVRSAAAIALGQITPQDRADTVVDKLLPLLGDLDPESGNYTYQDVRSAAAQALGQVTLEHRADAVIDKLLPLLDDEDSYAREAAARALGQISPQDRAGAVVDKLLPLLDLPNKIVQPAAAEALGKITPKDRVDTVINKLLPLLGQDLGGVNSAALEAIGRIGPGGVAASITAIQLINSREDAATGWLRASVHVATGGDDKNEGSEMLLAWMGRPAELPLDTVMDNPAQAQKVLQLLTNNWAVLSTEPRAREEAENAAMAAIEAACRTPAETSSLADFARASLAWLQDLPTEGPVHRCWTPEQKATVKSFWPISGSPAPRTKRRSKRISRARISRQSASG